MAFVIEVLDEWRSGRGRFWRPGAAGYTDKLSRAGVYSKADADRITFRSDRNRAVPLSDLLDARFAELFQELEALRLLAEAAGLPARVVYTLTRPTEAAPRPLEPLPGDGDAFLASGGDR